jgi:hypothetical protein
MTKGMLVAAAALLALGGLAFATERSGLMGSADTPGLLAAEVRLTPERVAVAQETPPPVLGAAVDCPPAGAGPEDSQQRYEDLGAAFRVIGTLSSFDAVTAVVSGPTGEISAGLAQQFDLRGDLSAGSIVDLRGTIADGGARTAHQIHSACAAAGVIDCATVDDPHFQLHVDGDTFEVTGRLESLSADQVQVLGPGLTVEIKREPGTQIEGGLTTGDPVTVAGTVLSDRQLQALTVALHCQEEITATPAPTAASVTPDGQLADTAANDDGDEDQDDDNDCRRASGRAAARLSVDDGEVRIRNAAVLSSDSRSLTVDTPAGPFVVRIDDETEVRGDLDAADDIEIEGELADANSVQASRIEVLCAAGSDEDDDHEGRDNRKQNNEDKDVKDDKEQDGRREEEDDEGGGDD